MQVAADMLQTPAAKPPAFPNATQVSMPKVTPTPAVMPQSAPAPVPTPAAMPAPEPSPVSNYGPPAEDSSSMPSAPMVINRKLNGKQILADLMTGFLRQTDGDSTHDIAWKIRKVNDLQTQVQGMPEFGEEEAKIIAAQWYAANSDTPTPTQSFSPESQQMLDMAFGGAPDPVYASDRHIDKGMLAAAAGMMIGNLFHGRSVGDAAPLIQRIMDDANQKAAMENQTNQQSYEAKRQRAMEMYKRMTSIEDANFVQQGYAARDGRMMDRQGEQAIAIAQRQADAARASEIAQSRAAIRNAILTGDPGRIGPLIDFHEANYPEDKLTDSVRNLSPTINQKGVMAKTANTEKTGALIDQQIRKATISNDLAEATFNDAVKQSQYKTKLSKGQLDKLEMEVKSLPAYYSARTAALLANASAHKMQAEAALIRANKPAAAGNPKAQDIGLLKSIISGTNTEIDNITNNLRRTEAELASAQARETRAKLLMSAGEASAQADLDIATADVTTAKAKQKDLEAALKKATAAGHGAVQRLQTIGGF